MKNWKEKLLDVYAYFCLAWVALALAFQVTLICLDFKDPKLATKVSNELIWKLDDTFKK